MDQKLRNILTELSDSLKSLYGKRLVHIILFGSHAREENCYDSDIDIMVILEGTVNPGEEIERAGNITARISLKHDVLVSCIFLSSERYKIKMSPLLLNVRREGIIL